MTRATQTLAGRMLCVERATDSAGPSPVYNEGIGRRTTALLSV
ncbi:MAG: hypothetical protein M5U29_00150 [Anaerolineae bacterium]|nr:hypothetical protein [Anaerolineae bacterium]